MLLVVVMFVGCHELQLRLRLSCMGRAGAIAVDRPAASRSFLPSPPHLYSLLVDIEDKA